MAHATNGRHTDNWWLETLASAVSQDAAGVGTLTVSSTGTNNQVTGNVASSATDSGNPVKVGGVYNTSPPVLTNGQRGDAQVDSRASLIVALAAAGVLIGGLADNADAQAVVGTNSRLAVTARNSVYNGTTWDRQRGSATGGTFVNVAATPTVTTVAVATSSTSVLASNTNRKAVVFTNVGANNIYLNLAGGTAVNTNTLIVPNATFVWDKWVSTGAITGIAATGATNLSVTEMA